MSSETERAAFEAWYGTEYGDDLQRDTLGDYAHGALVLQWEAWQARAAIAVQPPAASQPSDEPFPGMSEAFEAHYSQPWADPDWRHEESTWAAAWKAATRAALATPPAASQPSDTQIEVLIFKVMRENSFPVLASTVPMGKELAPFAKALVREAFAATQPPAASQPSEAEKTIRDALVIADRLASHAIPLNPSKHNKVDYTDINAIGAAFDALSALATQPPAASQPSDEPFPGMSEAFEAHYSQPWADPDWRHEASTWAAAWKAATRAALATSPAASQPSYAATERAS